MLFPCRLVFFFHRFKRRVTLIRLLRQLFFLFDTLLRVNVYIKATDAVQLFHHAVVVLVVYIDTEHAEH